MRLRHLLIRIQTTEAVYGVSMPFSDGLVVLRADNSAGKSTCLKSVLWALGLEAMLTVSQSDVPLAPALKVSLETEQGSLKVVESEVAVEIENRLGERIVATRAIAGRRSTQLVKVTRGPALTKPVGSYRSEDYFVSRPGAATSQLGFHQMFSNFLGWELPVVQTYEGRECPLCLQCVFPYFFVEQTKGWAGLQPPVPTQFRIRDVHRRVVEFILKLDSVKISARRQQLLGRERGVEAEWTTAVKELADIADSINGTIDLLPDHPVALWPPTVAPQFRVLIAGEPRSLTDVMTDEVARISELMEKEIPRVLDVVDAVSRDLQQAEEDLRGKEALLARLQEVLESEKIEISAADSRISVLEEDLRRNRDVQVLQGLGSLLLPPVLASECPTCHQALKEALAPLDREPSLMSIDENIKFVAQQKKMFEATRAHAVREVAGRERQIAAIQAEIATARGRIRVIRQTLVSDGRAPSAEAIRERLQLEDMIARHERAWARYNNIMKRMSDLAANWRSLRGEFESLPKDDLSIADRKKLDELSQLFRDHLEAFSFSSLRVNELSISRDSFRPEHEGFDLPTNISASDFIRVIWSYLMAFLDVSGAHDTNHPGVLVVDEPRQQSTKLVSFAELLRRLAGVESNGQQVLVATSEESDSLRRSLQGVQHQYIEFSGRILKKL